MKLTKFVCTRILLLGVSGAILVAQGVVGAQEKQGGKELKKVPITYSKPESGAQMYKDYCAACHGTEGRGDGPAVEFLKVAPPDLRTMAQRNSGKYPGDRVATTLRFGTGTRAHGTSDMPIWGPVFRSQDADKNVSEPRMHNLNAYIESLQQK